MSHLGWLADQWWQSLHQMQMQSELCLRLEHLACWAKRTDSWGVCHIGFAEPARALVTTAFGLLALRLLNNLSSTLSEHATACAHSVQAVSSKVLQTQIEHSKAGVTARCRFGSSCCLNSEQRAPDFRWRKRGLCNSFPWETNVHVLICSIRLEQDMFTEAHKACWDKQTR